jgi:hypothetical protein
MPHSPRLISMPRMAPHRVTAAGELNLTPTAVPVGETPSVRRLRGSLARLVRRLSSILWVCPTALRSSIACGRPLALPAPRYPAAGDTGLSRFSARCFRTCNGVSARRPIRRSPSSNPDTVVQRAVHGLCYASVRAVSGRFSRHVFGPLRSAPLRSRATCLTVSHPRIWRLPHRRSTATG